MTRKQIGGLFLLVLIVIAALLARYLILSRATPINLKRDSVAYVVEEALQGSSSNYRPLEDVDYKIDSQKAFNNDWLVISVKPLNNSLNTETLVLQKKGGQYVSVYGPSNFFQGSDFNALPTDIKNYLGNK